MQILQPFNPDATMDTVRQLFDKAKVNHGWTLMPSQVRALVMFIKQIDTTLTDAFAKNESVDEITNMLAAYVNEYGEELYNELLENIVEGEVVDADEDETKIGQTSERAGVDAQVEEQE